MDLSAGVAMATIIGTGMAVAGTVLAGMWKIFTRLDDKMDARFDKVDARFDKLEGKLDFP